MKKLLQLQTYHWLMVFMLCGGFAIVFAFTTYNLFHLSMSNVSFIRQFGWEAVQLGALTQLAHILINGAFSLFCYLGFKLCETELIGRYHRWKNE